MGRGTTSKLKVQAAELLRKGSNLLDNASEQLLEGTEAMSEIDRLGTPVYDTDSSQAEREFIARRGQLADGVSSGFLIGRGSNTLVLRAIEQSRFTNERDPLTDEERWEIMDHGVIRSGRVGRTDANALTGWPSDRSDLARCELTYKLAPGHLRLPMLHELRIWREHITGSSEETIDLVKELPQPVREIFYPEQYNG